MFSKMFLALSPILYFEISEKEVKVKNTKTKKDLAEPPFLSIQTVKGKKIVRAAGKTAQRMSPSNDTAVINIFSSSDLPQTLDEIAAFFNYLAREILKGTFISPKVVFHLKGVVNGKFCNIDLIHFQELGERIGAHQIEICTDPHTLSDRQIETILLKKKSFSRL